MAHPGMEFEPQTHDAWDVMMYSFGPFTAHFETASRTHSRTDGVGKRLPSAQEHLNLSGFCRPCPSQSI